LQKLSYKGISHLYVPLAASWVLMLLETPLINAFLARGSAPELDLAAFGVALSIILVVEAPILMMLELSIALSRDLYAFHRIRLFYATVGLAITALGVALFYTPLWQVLLYRLMHIPAGIADEAAFALRILAWWSFPIGWRRVYQGVLINDGRTRIISVATAVRILVLVCVMLAGQRLPSVPGAALASLAMVAAVTVETGVTHWAARSSIARRLSTGATDLTRLNQRYLWSFYLPLAITSVLRQSIRPVINAGMASAPLTELSLAAWPVAFSLVSIFWGPTMALQQVTVALTTDRDSWRTVTRFVLAAGLLLTAALGILCLDPLLDVTLKRLGGLSDELAALAVPCTRIMILLPLAYTFHALFTGLLVRRGRTSPVRSAKIVNLVVVVGALLAGLKLSPLPGAILGSWAICSGALFEAIWLYWRSRPAAREIAESPSETAS
jgi:Na+-driven multidrug efflux pump